MTVDVEAERKYALAPGQDLPDLGRIATLGTVEEFDLDATYYDTLDHRLTHAGRILRRRIGGHDAGWHLKLPGGTAEERLEFRLPPEPARLPPELRERVAETLSGAPVIPVAVLRTRRRQQQLLSPAGEVLALSCLDHVRAEVDDRRDEWKEFEVELVSGDRRLLAEIDAALRGAGIDRAASGSKIARALGNDGRAAAGSELGPDASAAMALLAYLADQVGVLQTREAAVRVDGVDAVHRSRVATRRLRTALRTYARVLADSPKPLRAELRWHAEELGGPRDSEVLADHLLVAAQRFPGAEAVAASLGAALSEAHAAAHAELVASMNTPRYEDLQLALTELLAHPRWSAMAGKPARTVLPPLLERAVERARRLADHAAARPSDMTRWHEVRKAAKAARYGSEVLVPVLGETAVEWRDSWKAVTEALGRVQDAVVAQQLIGELAGQAAAGGADWQPFDDFRHAQDQSLREALAQGRLALAAALA